MLKKKHKNKFWRIFRKFLLILLLQHFVLDLLTYFKSRRMRLAGHVARMGEKRHVYRILVGKPE
jgi:hypothetical protein